MLISDDFYSHVVNASKIDLLLQAMPLSIAACYIRLLHRHVLHCTSMYVIELVG